MPPERINCVGAADQIQHWSINCLLCPPSSVILSAATPAAAILASELSLRFYWTTRIQLKRSLARWNGPEDTNKLSCVLLPRPTDPCKLAFCH